MIEYLQKYEVGKRMFAGFGLLIVLMILISHSALSSFKPLDNEFKAVGVDSSTRLRHAHNVLLETA